MVLRAQLSLTSKLVRNPEHKRVLAMLLEDPRTCYTHLFPGYANRWLWVITPSLVVVQWLALVSADLAHRSEDMINFSVDRGMLAAFTVSVTSRSSGMSPMDLSELSVSSAFVLCVCMFVSVSPVVVVMRATAVRFSSMVSHRPTAEEKEDEDAGQLKNQLSYFMRQNTLLLVAIILAILYIEEWNQTKSDRGQGEFLVTLFEFCSAYGGVGLSMARGSYARSGDWLAPAKLLIMLVMILGRLRELPASIDPTWAVDLNEDNEDQEEYSNDGSEC